MTRKQKTALAALGLAMLIALTGCDNGKPHVQKAEAAAAFMETARAEDLNVTLAIEPLKVGENRFLVTVSDKEATAVEAQVVMASMGHGTIVDLQRTAPGTFEITTGAIDHDGRWLIRVLTTTRDGAEKTATFHLVVK